MAWMRQMRQNYEDEGAEGFYVMRGSTYPCDYCQSYVGFHQIDEAEAFPPQHANCACFAIPVFQKTIEETSI